MDSARRPARARKKPALFEAGSASEDNRYRLGLRVSQVGAQRESGQRKRKAPAAFEAVPASEDNKYRSRLKQIKASNRTADAACLNGDTTSNDSATVSPEYDSQAAALGLPPPRSIEHELYEHIELVGTRRRKPPARFEAGSATLDNKDKKLIMKIAEVLSVSDDNLQHSPQSSVKGDVVHKASTTSMLSRKLEFRRRSTKGHGKSSAALRSENHKLDRVGVNDDQFPEMDLDSHSATRNTSHNSSRKVGAEFETIAWWKANKSGGKSKRSLTSREKNYSALKENRGILAFNEETYHVGEISPELDVQEMRNIESSADTETHYAGPLHYRFSAGAHKGVRSDPSKTLTVNVGPDAKSVGTGHNPAPASAAVNEQQIDDDSDSSLSPQPETPQHVYMNSDDVKIQPEEPLSSAQDEVQDDHDDYRVQKALGTVEISSGFPLDSDLTEQRMTVVRPLDLSSKDQGFLSPPLKSPKSPKSLGDIFSPRELISPSGTVTLQSIDLPPIGTKPAELSGCALLWRPCSEQVTDEYLARIALMETNVTKRLTLERVLQILMEADFDLKSALDVAQNLSRSDESLKGNADHESIDGWSQSDQTKFEKLIIKHGKKFNTLSKELESKNVADCVSFYYHWKKTQRGSETLLERKKNLYQNVQLHAPVKQMFVPMPNALQAEESATPSYAPLEVPSDHSDTSESNSHELILESNGSNGMRVVVSSPRRKRGRPLKTSEKEVSKETPDDDDSEMRRPVKSYVKKRENKNEVENNIFIVESILGMRKAYKIKGLREFKVKWQGYPESDATWEPEQNLSNNTVLLEYLESQEYIIRSISLLFYLLTLLLLYICIGQKLQEPGLWRKRMTFTICCCHSFLDFS